MYVEILYARAMQNPWRVLHRNKIGIKLAIKSEMKILRESTLSILQYAKQSNPSRPIK